MELKNVFPGAAVPSGKKAGNYWKILSLLIFSAMKSMGCNVKILLPGDVDPVQAMVLVQNVSNQKRQTAN